MWEWGLPKLSRWDVADVDVRLEDCDSILPSWLVLSSFARGGLHNIQLIYQLLQPNRQNKMLVFYVYANHAYHQITSQHWQVIWWYANHAYHQITCQCCETAAKGETTVSCSILTFALAWNQWIVSTSVSMKPLDSFSSWKHETTW